MGKALPEDARKKRFFLLICIVGAFAIFSSTMSKNPVLNPFAQSLNTPGAMMGLVAAASTVPGILISMPAGSLSDILGRRKVLLASSIVFCSAPFLYLLVGSWWQLALVRFYHGFATAIFIPVARAAIAEQYPSEKGEKISTFTSATIVGRAIAPFLGGFILDVTVYDYRVLYLTVGVAGTTALLTTLALLREIYETPKHLPPHPPLDSHRDGRETKAVRGYRAVLGNLGILATSVVDAAVYYVYGALEFFLVGYLTALQFDAFLIGVISGMQLVLVPIVNPLMGRLSDRFGRKIPIISGLLISGLPLIALPYTVDLLPILLISMAYGLGFSMVTSSTPALVGDLATKESYGAAMGFLATIMDCGQALGPTITGLIFGAFGYSSSFFSLGAILLGFCAFFAVFQRIAST